MNLIVFYFRFVLLLFYPVFGFDFMVFLFVSFLFLFLFLFLFTISFFFFDSFVGFSVFEFDSGYLYYNFDFFFTNKDYMVKILVIFFFSLDNVFLLCFFFNPCFISFSFFCFFVFTCNRFIFLLFGEC